MTGITLPAFPNWYPFNDLLLDGRLIAKTRSYHRHYRGPMLLYTSTRAAAEVARIHGYDLADHPKGTLVGVGNLVDVRDLDDKEWFRLFCQFNNVGRRAGIKLECSGEWICEPFPIGYFFRDLARFSSPILFKPPRGAVTSFNVPVRGRLLHELRDAGYSVGKKRGVRVR